MATSSPSVLQRKLKLAEGKRAQCFLRIQNVYDLIRNLNESNASTFVAQAQMADDLRSEFQSHMDEINMLNLELNEDYIVNYKSMNAFDDLYCVVKSKLSKLDAPKPSAMTKIESPHVCRDDSIKIPRIELPNFDGEIQNFPFFYETFKRAVHENPKLLDSERVHYLFSHLTGKAKSVCAGIVPSGENYRIVWDALILKYHDERALATSYLNQLFSMKPVSGPSASNLEKVIDKFAATVSALKQLKIDNLSEFIFIHLGLKLIDSDTAKGFEMSIRDIDRMPNYDEFIRFLREQVKILYRTSQRSLTKSDNTSLAGSSGGARPAQNGYPRVPRALLTTQENATTAPCVMCNSSEHSQLYSCNSFLKLIPTERFNLVKQKQCCTNCLSVQHTASKCTSKKTCRKCQGKHHSLLHFNSQTNLIDKNESNHPSTSANVSTANVDTNTSAANSTNNTSLVEDSVCVLSSTESSKIPSTEILATAKVLVVGRNGKDQLIRCLLDPGSQKHYVTAKCCKTLGLNVSRGSIASVKGIGGATQPVRGNVNVSFRSRFETGALYAIEALVLDEITSELPTCRIDVSSMDSFDDVPLADDTWGIPGQIDLLIGVKLFAEMLLPGKVINQPGLPDALETALGYIILGNAPVVSRSSSTVGYCATYDIEQILRKFWEVEDLGQVSVLSEEEKQAEECFKSTVARKADGSYLVALPFKLNSSNLGNSYKIAERRYLALERKFKLQPKLKVLYDEVIKEHLDKKYLSEVQVIKGSVDDAYYIPHHAICREDRATTKLRVVLDASAKTTSGFSLNDILHAGPSLQADLFCILLNLRLFSIAITADVRQMYLCIHVREDDQPYQRILYRFDPQDVLKIYQYNRVAFGLRSSPFLALRTIQELVANEGDRFPFAKEIASRDIYMDDIASSVINEDQAVDAAQQLIALFNCGGFQLAKWSSNSSKVLSEVPKHLHLNQSVAFDDETTLKILGLRWYPSEDVFCFHVVPDERPCTKRNILSSVARLFDVLGLVAPIIVYAKLLIKELWLLKIDWDEMPPDYIIRQWQQFQTELPLISNLKFPRHLGVVESCTLTIIGFADASEKAYGGVVYVHVTIPNSDDVSIHLVCAKSKVAPLQTVSLARLELCAAVLLSQLIKKVVDNYSSRFPIDSVLAFSDSTVALCWIHSSPHRWQTFVANRVAKIQSNLENRYFYHVKGSENPSDCLSRGLSPGQLINHPLWLTGPPWMITPKPEWPVKPFVPESYNEVPEIKSVSLVTTDISENVIYNLSLKFSSWSKYVRTVAFIFKFLKKLPRGKITANDLIFAEFEIIRALQTFYFSEDISNIKRSKPCSNQIYKLKPFLHNNLLRVGGRLVNSDENFDYKHPILLPRRDHVIDLIVDYYHKLNFHTGPENLMSILRHRYWIISARRIIRQRIHKCNFCFRVKPRAIYPMMADLPSLRVNQAHKAFVHTGCDYAGPFLCTPVRRRGVKSQKTYICLFTCLTTRAIHLELASDLSTATFLSAFKRFLSRRGPIKFLYTDNGTNYIGAKAYLQELHNFLAQEYKDTWEKELADNRIVWRLIPPSAPHFGGCWESNVKCVKTHLFRTIGNQILSFEEFATVLTQIEAVLNSRPLTALSADPSEPTALTPAHFLNTLPLNYFPALPVSDGSDHMLQRFQLLDKLTQSFWKRWRDEYLHTLQVRQKWNSDTQPVKEGTLVIIMQENVMPLQWPLGIITNLFTGKDGIARVALVKTKGGIFKRPLVKLCPLPLQ